MSRQKELKWKFSTALIDLLPRTSPALKPNEFDAYPKPEASPQEAHGLLRAPALDVAPGHQVHAGLPHVGRGDRRVHSRRKQQTNLARLRSSQSPSPTQQGPLAEKEIFQKPPTRPLGSGVCQIRGPTRACPEPHPHPKHLRFPIWVRLKIRGSPKNEWRPFGFHPKTDKPALPLSILRLTSPSLSQGLGFQRNKTQPSPEGGLFFPFF